MSYMVSCIVTPLPGEIMWILDLNVAGYHVTRELPDLRRRPFRFSPRNMHWPLSQHQTSHAA